MNPDMNPVVSGQEVEVVAKAERRRFPAQYKLRILREAEACTRPGELGALLRREGLYSSHLTAWRAARKRGELEGLTAKKRGPRPMPRDGRDKRIAELDRENKRLRARAERAEGLVAVQKKVAELLGMELPTTNGK
jgi:transposase-like protein